MKKTILVLSGKYAAESNNRYLTNDLVDGLLRDYRVISLAYSSKNEIKVSEDGNKIELLVKLRSGPKYIKYLLIWFRLLFLAMYAVIKFEINYIISFAPLSVIWPALAVFAFSSAEKKLCIVFDIFPVHQIKIGLIPSQLSKILIWFEGFWVSQFTTVSGMTGKNVEFIKRIYFADSPSPNSVILPPWGSVPNINEELSIECIRRVVEDKKIRFVFGGQIGKGRSLESCIKLIEAMANRGYSVTFDVYADPNGRAYLNRIVSDTICIQVLDYLPREEYLRQLSSYDFGMVATDPRVDMPSFPSKIIDYISCGLRCVCMLEENTDIKTIFPFDKLLFLCDFDFDKISIENLEKFITSADYYGELGQGVDVLSTRNALGKVLSCLK